MTGHGTDYDQLRELVETFAEKANQAIGQADEQTAMLVERTVDDSQDEYRPAFMRVLDAALALDDAGLRRKVQRLRDTLAASEEERRVDWVLASLGPMRAVPPWAVWHGPV